MCSMTMAMMWFPFLAKKLFFVTRMLESFLTIRDAVLDQSQESWNATGM